MSDDYRRTKIGPTAEPPVEDQRIQRAERAAALEVAETAAPLSLGARVAWALGQPLFWLGVASTALIALVLAVVVLAGTKRVLPVPMA